MGMNLHKLSLIFLSAGGTGLPVVPVVSYSLSVAANLYENLPLYYLYHICRDSLLLEAGFLAILVAPLNFSYWRK